jgi:hypothetical protein
MHKLIVLTTAVLFAAAAAAGSSPAVAKPKQTDKASPTLLRASTAPRDPASGLPTGKRMHKPFVITREAR